jgi:iron complex outermembrane receptor protein
MKRILTLAAVLLAGVFSPTVSAQNGYQVKGVVVDAQGPVIGATVLEKGTSNGTSTGLDGDYVLNVSGPDAIVEVSCIGYATQSFAASAMPGTVTLAEDTEFLDDVVVIGYGTPRAKNFTGSVDVLKMADSPVADLGLNNLADVLRGRLSGVNLGAESPTVGSNASIRVRGRRSIASTSSNPLLVVNGVIFSGNIEDIDQNSIESVSVLKDATSLAA